MFKVSEEASKKIKQELEGREGLPIRILVTEDRWRGAYLVMAQDEQKENDEVFTDRGVTFIIEKTLFERVKPLSIDYFHSTFGSGYILHSEFLKGPKGIIQGCESIC